MSVDFGPLRIDRGRKGKVIVKACPTCGKQLKAHSDKQWEFVYKVHRVLSKRHERR